MWNTDQGSNTPMPTAFPRAGAPDPADKGPAMYVIADQDPTLPQMLTELQDAQKEDESVLLARAWVLANKEPSKME